MQALDDEVAWAERLTVPLTSAALDLLAVEAIAEDDAGQTEDVTGDEFLT